MKDTGLEGLLLGRPFNVAALAQANKNAGIVWALMTTGDDYNPRLARTA